MGPCGYLYNEDIKKCKNEKNRCKKPHAIIDGQ
jgi:hypothetical protein